MNEASHTIHGMAAILQHLLQIGAHALELESEQDMIINQ